MFIEIKTDKDELLLLNMDSVLFILEDKKGKTIFFLNDGTSFNTLCSLDFYNAILHRDNLKN